MGWRHDLTQRHQDLPRGVSPRNRQRAESSESMPRRPSNQRAWSSTQRRRLQHQRKKSQAGKSPSSSSSSATSSGGRASKSKKQGSKRRRQQKSGARGRSSQKERSWQ